MSKCIAMTYQCDHDLLGTEEDIMTIRLNIIDLHVKPENEDKIIKYLTRFVFRDFHANVYLKLVEEVKKLDGIV